MKKVLIVVIGFIISLAILTWCANKFNVKEEKISIVEDPLEVAEEREIATVKTSSDIAKEIASTMTLNEKIYQLFIVKQEQISENKESTIAEEYSKQGLEEHPVGGIIYFSKNIVNRNQVTKMIDNVQSYSKLGLFIAVDEEGGMVARVANNSRMGTTKFPNMGSIKTTERAYKAGYTIGTEIKELGFNLDFAPVADVNSNPNNTVIGKRAFSSNATTTANMVKSIVKGFKDSKISCTLKHFPGHGDTATDSHYGAAESKKTLDQLWKTEFIPFQEGINAGAEFVMVAHVALPKVTGDKTPATLSKEIIDILKDDLKFEGIVITDSMEMEAITSRWNSDTAAVKAINSGVDIILMPKNLELAFNGILEAVQNGEITEERINQSVEKIIKYKLEKGIVSTEK